MYTSPIPWWVYTGCTPLPYPGWCIACRSLIPGLVYSLQVSHTQWCTGLYLSYPVVYRAIPLIPQGVVCTPGLYLRVWYVHQVYTSEWCICPSVYLRVVYMPVCVPQGGYPRCVPQGGYPRCVPQGGMMPVLSPFLWENGARTIPVPLGECCLSAPFCSGMLPFLLPFLPFCTVSSLPCRITLGLRTLPNR